MSWKMATRSMLRRVRSSRPAPSPSISAYGGDAADVGAGDGVVGVDGVEQRLERRRAKPLGLRPHAVLAEQQPARRRGADREWDEVFHAGRFARSVRQYLSRRGF